MLRTGLVRLLLLLLLLFMVMRHCRWGQEAAIKALRLRLLLLRRRGRLLLLGPRRRRRRAPRAAGGGPAGLHDTDRKAPRSSRYGAPSCVPRARSRSEKGRRGRRRARRIAAAADGRRRRGAGFRRGVVKT